MLCNVRTFVNPNQGEDVRPIASGEKCLSATEIADLFEEKTGYQLHPTNVGNAASKLDLDYIEVEFEDSTYQKWGKQKLYAEADIPAIFGMLTELAERRARFD